MTRTVLVLREVDLLYSHPGLPVPHGAPPRGGVPSPSSPHVEINVENLARVRKRPEVYRGWGDWGRWRQKSPPCTDCLLCSFSAESREAKRRGLDARALCVLFFGNKLHCHCEVHRRVRRGQPTRVLVEECRRSGIVGIQTATRIVARVFSQTPERKRTFSAT